MALPLVRLLRVTLGLLLLSLGLSACGAIAPQSTAQSTQTSDLAPGTITAHLNGRVNFYAGVGGGG